MFRDLFIRLYSPNCIKKIDLMRAKGLDITNLIEKFILSYEIGGENA